jgi:hypothetical protein
MQLLITIYDVVHAIMHGRAVGRRRSLCSANAAQQCHNVVDKLNNTSQHEMKAVTAASNRALMMMMTMMIMIMMTIMMMTMVVVVMMCVYSGIIRIRSSKALSSRCRQHRIPLKDAQTQQAKQLQVLRSVSWGERAQLLQCRGAHTRWACHCCACACRGLTQTWELKCEWREDGRGGSEEFAKKWEELHMRKAAGNW